MILTAAAGGSASAARSLTPSMSTTARGATSDATSDTARLCLPIGVRWMLVEGGLERRTARIVAPRAGRRWPH